MNLHTCGHTVRARSKTIAFFTHRKAQNFFENRTHPVSSLKIERRACLSLKRRCMLRRRPLIFHLVSVWPAENDPWTTCSPQLPMSSNSKHAQDSLSNFCYRWRCSFQFTFGLFIEICTMFLKIQLSNASF
jgi:hypothetical protein